MYMYNNVGYDAPDFYNKYYSTTVDQCESYKYTNQIKNPNTMDIYIPCYNNLFCVEYQIKTLQHNMTEPIEIFICDNNCGVHPDISKQTLELCIYYGVTYIKLPYNKFENPINGSMKLGSTMNWIFQNVAKVRNPKYFGFLDQDNFLFKKIGTYLTDYLNLKHMYGDPYKSKIKLNAWNIHVANCFYLYDAVKNIELDFRPHHLYGLDTGGLNSDILYSKYKFEDYIMNQRHVIYFPNVLDESTLQSNSCTNMYVVTDNIWAHIWNSASTKHDRSRPIDYFRGFLDHQMNFEV